MAKHILVIDDMRTFIAHEGSDLEFTHARTAREGVAVLQGQTFDELWLDCDLKHLNPDPGFDNGRRVTCWLHQELRTIPVHASRR